MYDIWEQMEIFFFLVFTCLVFTFIGIRRQQKLKKEKYLSTNMLDRDIIQSEELAAFPTRQDVLIN